MSQEWYCSGSKECAQFLKKTSLGITIKDLSPCWLFTDPDVLLPNFTYKQSTQAPPREIPTEEPQVSLPSAAPAPAEEESTGEKLKGSHKYTRKGDPAAEDCRSLKETWLCIAMQTWALKVPGALHRANTAASRCQNPPALLSPGAAHQRSCETLSSQRARVPETQR